MEEINSLMNEVNWMLSLFIAIPLSIAANLLTPYFQNRFAKKSKTRAKARIEVLLNDLRQLEILHTSPEKFSNFISSASLRVILFFALPGVIAGFSQMVYAVPDSYYLFTNIATAISGIASAFFNLLAVLQAQRTLFIMKKVENYDSVKAEIESQIESIKNSTV